MAADICAIVADFVGESMSMHLIIELTGDAEASYSISPVGRMLSCKRHVDNYRKSDVPDVFKHDPRYIITDMRDDLVQVFKKMWTLSDVGFIQKWLHMLIDQHNDDDSITFQVVSDFFPETTGSSSFLKEHVTLFLDMYKTSLKT